MSKMPHQYMLSCEQRHPYRWFGQAKTLKGLNNDYRPRIKRCSRFTEARLRVSQAGSDTNQTYPYWTHSLGQPVGRFIARVYRCLSDHVTTECRPGAWVFDLSVE
eukprot:9501966-Pyramimonas_sp.AAC.1